MPPDSRPVALVTGAARRVGAAIVRALHAAGYDIALHYRHAHAEALALQAELEAARPASVLTVRAELAELDALPRLIEQVQARYDRLDALVNNASTFYATPLAQATPAQWQDLFAANAQAPFFLAQAARPLLAARGGAIVNLADIYAERALAGHPIYCMAKAALLAMTRALALDLAPTIRVNAIAPGAVLWPQDDAGADQAALLARTPLQRTGTPQDVAAAVRWLLDDAPFVTGQTLRIDGGRTLGV